MNQEKRYCACGCGSELMGNDPSRIYRRGHSPKPQRKKCITEGCDNFTIGKSKYCKECLKKLIPGPRPCACGCGGIVTSTLREVRFLPGHNATTQECKDKARATCNIRYGGNGPMCSKETQKKSILKVRDVYGVDNVFQSEIIKSKSKKTLLRDWGVDCITKNKDVIELVKEKEKLTKRIKAYNRLTKNFREVQLISTQEEYLKYRNNEIDILKWKCSKCGSIFEARSDSNLFLEARCFKCHPYVLSKDQQEIFDFLKSLNFEVQQDRRDIIAPQELDCYIATKSIAIEYNGLYWHSFREIPDMYYHFNKLVKCLEKNIQLIQIFEDEWLLKKDLVKYRLKNILGKYDNIVYARKCIVKEVNFDLAKKFLDENHIQGSCNSKYRYGLFYNDELISLMTFGGYRKALGRSKIENEYEMLRFCNKLGYHIPGAASRLFRHFVKDHNPEKVISYADRRWSRGKLYEALGFSLVRETEPNYWYIIGNHREHRFAWRKSVLKDKLSIFDETKTEYENMLLNKHDKIYDCGSLLYEWKRSSFSTE